MSEKLTNKPLVEAIFEINWHFSLSEDSLTSLNYQRLVGSFFEKIQHDYPIYQPISNSLEVIPEKIQHRFCKDNNEDPILQLGLGIFTINSPSYSEWHDFKIEILKYIDIFNLSQLNLNLSIKSIALRYIDLFNINLVQENIQEFLAQKLKTTIKIESSLFKNQRVKNLPQAFKLKLIFPCENPQGMMHFNLAKGHRSEQDIIICDYGIQSQSDDLSLFRKSPEQWLDESHTVAHDWFFALVEGELLENFR
ncbi:TIGR04255 family protein [Gloeocapsa sp. PCC 73106]|uniref:TIGR04255 family protein n=1 Tax=Gloeocapsa sp. PCC 73106 TaxID=102232 RepID=UPI0002ACA424|nr:TIGR04255 family protein [Gloeocapsa sp. PCC 73106]ELR97601.1 hypothetical protein GLO73106DRAFT_00014120 [Gloeocapsa sp. PCC 73106]